MTERDLKKMIVTGMIAAKNRKNTIPLIDEAKNHSLKFVSTE